MEELKVMQKHQDRIFNLPNIVGVGIGCKVQNGIVSQTPAIVALVVKKVDKAYLPEASMVPAELDGVVTDVREVGEIKLLGRTDKQRPACPGISIGHYKITAGTFGAMVYDNQTGDPLILSNNHVLANVTNGRDGRSAIGDAIYQPGSYDGGTSADTIAHLHRFVPVYYGSNSKANLVDCAVAKPISNDLIIDEIMEIGKVAGIAQAEVGMDVKKSGRTSGLTTGTIDTVHTTVKVNMGIGTATFKDQIVAGAMSQGGDSGSLVLNNQNEAVGLLFAGSDYTTIFNDIQNVLSALKVKF